MCTALSQIAITLNSIKPFPPNYSYNNEADSLLLIWRIQYCCVDDSCCSWTITEADQSHWSDVIVLWPMLLLLNIRIMLLQDHDFNSWCCIWGLYTIWNIVSYCSLNILHTSSLFCEFFGSVYRQDKYRDKKQQTTTTYSGTNQNNTNNNQHKYNATKKNIKQLNHSKMAQTKTTSMWDLSVKCRDLALDKQWQPSFLFTFCCMFGLAAICPLCCSQCYWTFRNVTLFMSNLKKGQKAVREPGSEREEMLKKVCFTVYLSVFVL